MDGPPLLLIITPDLDRMCGLSYIQALPGWGDGAIITTTTINDYHYCYYHH